MLWWTLRRARSHLASQDPMERITAVRSLADLPSPHRHGLLGQALNDADADVVEAAIAELSACQSGEAVPTFIPLLLDGRARACRPPPAQRRARRPRPRVARDARGECRRD